MIISLEAQALRYLFFAERNLSSLPSLGFEKQPSTSHSEPVDLATLKIGIVGSGLMGSGIASAFLLNGFKSVVINDASEAALKKAVKTIDKTIKGALQRKKISDTEAAACLKRVSTTVSLDRYINMTALITFI